ncbi:50S ribosomal protein L21 [Patescibacteria group bacterium]|nr:50S ribosomal protein L21 [Patescibacteria group bacterium]
MSDIKLSVIKTGGKQYKVQAGDKVKIEKILEKAGETVKFVTLLSSSLNGENLEIGDPTIKTKTEGIVLDHGHHDKVTVIKYKNKTRYKRNFGHKQPYTEIEITKI